MEEVHLVLGPQNHRHSVSLHLVGFSFAWRRFGAAPSLAAGFSLHPGDAQRRCREPHFTAIH